MKNEELKAMIAKRKLSLETVKNYIPLKTYYELSARLSTEEKKLQTAQTTKNETLVKELAPQTLSKQLFERKSMREKTIRIE